jgi:hypothetical protein
MKKRLRLQLQGSREMRRMWQHRGMTPKDVDLIFDLLRQTSPEEYRTLVDLINLETETEARPSPAE